MTSARSVRMLMGSLLCGCSEWRESDKGSSTELPSQQLSIFIEGELQARGPIQGSVMVTRAASDQCMGSSEYSFSPSAPLGINAPFSSLDSGVQTRADSFGSPVVTWEVDADGSADTGESTWHYWTGRFELQLDSEDLVQINLLEGQICVTDTWTSLKDAVCEEGQTSGFVEVQGAFYRVSKEFETSRISSFIDVASGMRLCSWI